VSLAKVINLLFSFLNLMHRIIYSSCLLHQKLLHIILPIGVKTKAQNRKKLIRWINKLFKVKSEFESMILNKRLKII